MSRISTQGAAVAVAAVSTTGLLVTAADSMAEPMPGATGERPAAAAATSAALSRGQDSRQFDVARSGAVDWRVAAARGYATTSRAPDRASRASARVALTPASAGNPKAIARGLVARHGWDGRQYACLDRLWQKESGWNHRRANAYSGAYGIPQALPGSKMATHGADWRTNPTTQIRWGLDYIHGRYGSPCGAWSFSRARNYY